ncbi:MAG: PASTA domain-containing protein [Desulfobulbaceae bacterium]|nr:PASTA domain-containing protein [Desulfobulbaceae bacterium]
MTKKAPAKSGKNRPLAIFAALFFLAWLVAVFFAVRDTFFPDPQRGKGPESLATLALPDSNRGRYPIVDRAGRDIAVSFPAKSVYARPLEVEHPDAVALFLARELGLPEQEIKRELKEERSFCWLGHQLSEAAVNNIQERKLRGIYVVDENKRFYPQVAQASQLIGFAREGHGLTGIEAQYDQQLQTTVDIPGEDGPPRGPLVLTLDLRIQELLAGELAQLVAATGATGGEGIVIDPRSGEVLALASQPTYDANFFGDYDENSQKNRVLSLALPASGFRSLFRLAASPQPEPPLPGSEAGGESVSPPKPEAKKDLKKDAKKKGGKGVVAPKPMRLAQFEGGYRSRGLAALDKLPEPPDFPAFLSRLGLGRKVIFDLPVVAVENAAVGEKAPPFRATGAELAVAVANLVNQDGGVAPKVVAGVLNSQTGVVQPQLRGETPAKLAPEVGLQTWEYLNRLTSELSGNIYLEELTEGPEPVAETVSEAEAPESGERPDKSAPVSPANPGIWGKTVARPAPAAKAPAPAPLVGEGNDKNSGKEKSEGKVEEVPKHYVSVLLALPGGEVLPEVVVLLALEGAQLDPAAPSPLREAVERIMPQLRSWAAEDSTVPGKLSWLANEPLWRTQWQKALAEHDVESRGTAKINRRQMPDLHGSSLRRALQLLNPYGLKVRIQGVGRVVEQRPEAGAPITGSDCVLILTGLNLINERPDRQLAVGLESGTDKLKILPLPSTPQVAPRGN